MAASASTPINEEPTWTTIDLGSETPAEPEYQQRWQNHDIVTGGSTGHMRGGDGEGCRDTYCSMWILFLDCFPCRG